MLSTRDKNEFIFSGRENGILFIHGFTSCPEQMKPMAMYFNDEGYTCYGIRLKGHCTDPYDLARFSDIDWIEDVTRAYQMLRSECARVFVCGISMGGSLGLYLAQNFKVDGVICMSAPVYVYLEGMLPAVVVLKHIKKFVEVKPSGSISIKWRFASSYSKVPISSIDSLYRIMRNVKREIDRVKCPVLIVQSYSDNIVKPESAQFIYENISSTRKKLLWLKKSSHNVINGVDKDTVFCESSYFLRQLLLFYG